MTSAEIKAKLGVETLGLSYHMDQDGKKTDWLRNWDNEKRRAVVMHDDVRKAIQDNPTGDNYGMKEEVKQGEKGEFTNIVIVAYKPSDFEI